MVLFDADAIRTCAEGLIGNLGLEDRDLRIEVAGLLAPTADVAILTYRASATRGEGPRYRALVSSGYVRRLDGWKLAFHQQTPLPQ